MRLTLYTDFSLRVLMYLGTKEIGELSTIQEISDRYDISKNHLTKVVHELGKMGLCGNGARPRRWYPPEREA